MIFRHERRFKLCVIVAANILANEMQQFRIAYVVVWPFLRSSVLSSRIFEFRHINKKAFSLSKQFLSFNSAHN